jgi:hypothetical protein
MTDKDCSILDGYVDRQQFAINEGISLRTAERYSSQPDGLPYVVFGGKAYIPIDDAREWLKSRIVRPNRRRRAT